MVTVVCSTVMVNRCLSLGSLPKLKAKQQKQRIPTQQTQTKIGNKTRPTFGSSFPHEGCDMATYKVDFSQHGLRNIGKIRPMHEKVREVPNTATFITRSIKALILLLSHQVDNGGQFWQTVLLVIRRAKDPGCLGAEFEIKVYVVESQLHGEITISQQHAKKR